MDGSHPRGNEESIQNVNRKNSK